MARKLGALDEMFRDLAGRPAGAVVVEEIAVERIRAGANPRKRFAEDGLAQLADSIREHGVLQPVVVTPAGDGYVLVAGERRWRAAKLAGLATICARVRVYTPEQAAAVSLIENLQREDLDGVERAEGLVALKGLLGTWEAVSRATGLHLRTLYRMAKVAALPDEAKLLVSDGRVAASTAAEAMSRLDDPDQVSRMLARAAEEGLGREDVIGGLRERDTVSPSDGAAAIGRLLRKVLKALQGLDRLPPEAWTAILPLADEVRKLIREASGQGPGPGRDGDGHGQE